MHLFSRAGVYCFALIVACGLAGCERTTKPVSPKPNQESSSSVANDQTDVASSLALAEAAYEEKDWKVAEQHYRSVAQAIPKEAQPWFRLGNIYARTERPDFAVAAYKEALLRDPELSKAWYNMGLVQLRQSANSFLQMQSHTIENSEQAKRADAMYKALMNVIQNGPDLNAEAGKP